MTQRRRPRLPDWWPWPRVVSGHAQRRMIERGLSLLQLQAALARVRRVRPSHESGRFVAECSLSGAVWHIVVEPQLELGRTIIVTAFQPD